VTVYVGSRDARRGQAAVDEIGGDARLLVLDVTGPASITDAARQLGARDVLVNNAGISLDSKLPNSAGVEASSRRTSSPLGAGSTPPSAPATHSSDRPRSHGPIQRTTTPSENKPKGRRVTTETGTRQPAGSDMTEFRPFRVEIGATDDARYTTGQTLGVDGGSFLHA
jgi:hypothetical protein